MKDADESNPASSANRPAFVTNHEMGSESGRELAPTSLHDLETDSEMESAMAALRADEPEFGYDPGNDLSLGADAPAGEAAPMPSDEEVPSIPRGAAEPSESTVGAEAAAEPLEDRLMEDGPIDEALVAALAETAPPHFPVLVKGPDGVEHDIAAPGFRYTDHPGLEDFLLRQDPEQQATDVPSINDYMSMLLEPGETLSEEEAGWVEHQSGVMEIDQFEALPSPRQQAYRNLQAALGILLQRNEDSEARLRSEEQLAGATVAELSLSDDERINLIEADAQAMAASTEAPGLPAPIPTPGESAPAIESVVGSAALAAAASEVPPAPEAARQPAEALSRLLESRLPPPAVAPSLSTSSHGATPTAGVSAAAPAAGALGAGPVYKPAVDLFRHPLVTAGYTMTMAIPNLISGTFRAWQDLAIRREDQALDQKLRTFDAKLSLFSSPGASEAVREEILRDLESLVPPIGAAFDACAESARRIADPQQRDQKIAGLALKLQSVQTATNQVISEIDGEQARKLREVAQRLAEAIGALITRICARFGIGTSPSQNQATSRATPQPAPASVPAASPPSPAAEPAPQF